MEPGSLRWNDVRFWPEDKLAGLEHLLVEEGQIILAMDRPMVSAGLKLARAKASDLPCLLVQRMARLRMFDDALTAFLHCSMQTHAFITHLLGDQTGTQLPHISGSGIEEFVTPLPPFVEQQQITTEVAEKLSQIEAAEMGIVKPDSCIPSASEHLEASLRGETGPARPAGRTGQRAAGAAQGGWRWYTGISERFTTNPPRSSIAIQEETKGPHMTSVTIEEAQAKLPELIEHLAKGEELVITRNQQPIARLLAAPKLERKPRKAGSAKGMLTIIAEDEEHLNDFAEYME